MKPAACVTAVAVLLAAAVAAAAMSGTAPAPALTLHPTVPLSAARLDHLQELDRARLARSSGVPEFGLLGMPGIYYTRVTLGNPPKQYSLQFDTGSNLMWLRCSPCTDCPLSGQLDASLYSPSNSSTSSNISCSDDICKDALKTGHSICQASDTTSNQCGYSQAYAGETTTEGYYVSDVMRFDTVMEKKNESATVSSASVIFGCSNSLSGHVQTDGFMGFGKDAPSVILQLSSQGVSPKAFSHCLTSSDDGGGIVVLGEVVQPGFVFTPLVQSQPRYNLNMKSIAVNGQKVPINSSFFTTSKTQGTFVDSGAALAYFPDGVYDPVIKAIVSAVPYSIRNYVMSGSRCFICSKRDVSSFPNVTLYFEGGAPMTVGPESYLLLKGGSTRHHNEVILCIGFLRSKEIEGYEHTTVLGDIILRDKVFVYDLEKTRIGWVNYNCSLLSKTSVVVSGGSSMRHAPSYCSGLVAIVVAIIHSNIMTL
ncbi:hypothetical protein ACQJBY_035816 [Aegilops geniculata]